MPADLTSMDAALKEHYTPEQIALAQLATTPKPKPVSRVAKHLPRLVKEQTDGK